MQVSQRITRKSASNLALAFALLPPAKRHAMAALYAFCREVDDIADDESLPVEERRQRLAAWRTDLRTAYDQRLPQFPVNQELQPVIVQYRLPWDCFDALIQGVEMDLDIKRYPDFPALETYCYRVASVVGLLSIEVFGYTHSACREYAVLLGKALQFTNILRDVRNDAERGRLYFPQSELDRFGVSAEAILRGEDSPAFRAVARSMAERARAFYRQARAVLPPTERPAMVAAELMGAVYWQLLRKIEARNFAVLVPPPIRLSHPHKAWMVLRAWLGQRAAAFTPVYGVG